MQIQMKKSSNNKTLYWYSSGQTYGFDKTGITYYFLGFS